MAKNVDVTREIKGLSEQLAALRAEVQAADRRARQAQDVARQAAQAAQLARGTSDVTAAAQAARAPKNGAVVKAHNGHPGPVAVPAARPAGPPKTRVGDAGPTSELMLAVQHLLRQRPMSFREILEETGARDGRVSGAIVRLQRDGAGVVNLGKSNAALWFIPDDDVLARLRAPAPDGE